MKTNSLNVYHLLALILGTMTTTPATAQPITPANDGTNTKVNQNGNHINIQGGTRSRDGTNLFHSFDKFNLNSGQTANFISTPDTRNILGRVTGGNASYINGLIQVIGGNSNLFLMNPAGIMFGSNASLNIPASFSVTTATGIGFDNNNYWFEAIGTNNYANLVGNPSGYRFQIKNPGAIVNYGNLTLNPGENLTLLGGTVINTGQLSTAGGNITIAATEGGSTLKISQPGNLLSLEVSSTVENGENISNLTPLSLPALLTGGETTHATSVIVNANGDVVLTNSNTLVADTPGTAITSGNIDVSSTEKIGGQINVLGSRVALIDTNINANGINGGGQILIGGDFQGNGIVPNSQQTFINKNSIISADAITNGDGGRVIVWSDGITNFAGNISAKGGEFSGNGGFVEVSGKQQLIFDGNVNVTAALGEVGSILFDPENIIVGESETTAENPETSTTKIADSSTETPEQTETKFADNSEYKKTETTATTETPIDPFAQDQKANVTISASNIGELSGDVILQADNDITINEKIETTESVELKAGRSININADIDTSTGSGNIDIFGNANDMNPANRSSGAASINQKDGTTLNAGSGTINIQLGNLGEIGNINLANLTTTGQVLVNANGGNIARISENSIINAGSALFQTSGSGGIGLSKAPLQLKVENLEASAGNRGAFFEAVGRVTVGGVSDDNTGILTINGGSIELSATENILVNEDISTAVIAGNAGNILIESHAGNITTTEAKINASSVNGDGGNIEIIAAVNITTADITTAAGELIFDKFGEVESTRGGNGNGGSIILNAGGNIDTNAGKVTSFSLESNGGNVTFTGDGDVMTHDIYSSSGYYDQEGTKFFGGGAGNGGNIVLESSGGKIDTTGEVAAPTVFIRDRKNFEIIVEPPGNPQIGVGETDNSFITDEENTALPIPIEIKDDSRINSSSRRGNGGNIRLTGAGDIITNHIFSDAKDGGVGGSIILNSGRNINTIGGQVVSASSSSNGGDIEITATGDILTGDILSRSQTSASINDSSGEGGNITLTAKGNINTTAGQLSSISTSTGNGGNIKLEGNGDILTGEIFSFSSSASDGNGGNIILNAGGIINTRGQLDSSANGNGGNIELRSERNILARNTFSFSRDSGTGGNITLNAGGFIDTTGGILNAGSKQGNAGNAEIIATDNISTGTIRTFADQQSGSINITSTLGQIDTTPGQLNSFSLNGAGGEITLTGEQTVITGNIFSSGKTQGGNINLNSNLSNVDTSSGLLDSRATDPNSNNGKINITANTGNIAIGKINGSQNITLENSGLDNPFGENPQNSVTADADRINFLSGEISLQAHNDITITEPIQSDSLSNLEIRAGRNININANIDTSGSNGNITLRANDNGANANYRQPGTGSVRMSAGTTLNAGSGQISIELGTLGEVGNIILDRVFTTGTVTVNAQSGNILRAANNSLITANSAIFQAKVNGGIGLSAEPLPININNLEAVGGSGGAFFNSLAPAVTIGNVSNKIRGISTTRGGDIKITAQGEITALEPISTSTTEVSGNITLQAIGDIDTTASQLLSASSGSAGDITLISQQNILTSDVDARSSVRGTAGNIALRAGGNIDATAGSLESSANNGNGGEVILTAKGDINTSRISSTSFAGGSGGDISIFTPTGEINTTTTSVSSLPADVDLTSEDVATRFKEFQANLDSYAPEGNGGDITLEAKSNIRIGDISSFGRENSGNIKLTTQQGNIDTGVIFSVGENLAGGNIFIETGNSGNININHIVSYSIEGAGGSINLNADGNVTINNVASFGGSKSGDVSIRSNIGNVETEEIITQATVKPSNTPDSVSRPPQAQGGPSGKIIVNGREIETGNISSIGTVSAGSIQVEATDGSIKTEDILSSASKGSAGQIKLRASRDIDTGTQKVKAQDGNAEIEAIAGGNLSTENQTVITGNGNATIDNQAGSNIAIRGNQTASAENGNAIIDNQAGGNIMITENQTASAENGNAIINNQAGGNITIGDNQTTSAPNGTETIKNQTHSTASNQIVSILEQNRINEYSNYFGQNFDEKMLSTQSVRNILTDIANQTGTESAVIYVNAYADQLQLILFTKNGQPILKTIPTANREQLIKTATKLLIEIKDIKRRNTNSYLQPSKELYNSLIAPIAAELEAAKIDTILFSMDAGLRLLPLAVLHDGKQFLIEKYNISMIPSISLMDNRYRLIHNTMVLGMGASEFVDNNPLPLVALELKAISQQVWQGNMFLNQEFTRQNLIAQRQKYSYPIIHLATHAEFRAGDASKSYIQLWDEKLGLDRLRKLGLNNPAVELLVLSSCQTAVGNAEAELGFAGLAVATGVKSVLGSLWLVNDWATFALMTDFYSHLGQVTTKAEALRRAQLAMLHGKVNVEQGVLNISGVRSGVSLPPSQASVEIKDFSHPYYWAGFTMVGSPW